jgi:hypothetical protein
MDCPACGLINPPEALACDCGYDFKSVKVSDTPGWNINLTWSQTLAAYWSISWPAFVGSYIAVMIFTNHFSLADLARRSSAVFLIGQLGFFCAQAILTPRLVRKHYRSFRIYAIRNDGPRRRSLSLKETVLVWLYLLAPQLAFLIALAIIAALFGRKLGSANVQNISTLAQWLRFLVVGPFAIGFAVRARYPGFRLQACGLRFA